MSQLILMKQRISAIETIKKITHAMQLISMSSHSRLRQKKLFIEQYQQAIHEIACSLQQYAQSHNTHHFSQPQGNKRLIIIVGSQKGLCGTFNFNLLKFFKKKETINTHTKIIIVGKMAVDFCSAQNINPDLAYTNFTTSNYVEIANTLTQNILSDITNLKEVSIYHMNQQSFFYQKPEKTILIPIIKTKTEKQKNPSEAIDFLWEEAPNSILEFTQELSLQATILEALFASLLSEQAARFVSMESATRNANNLLNDMKLEYNKTRQAKITLELTDLIAGMSNS